MEPTVRRLSIAAGASLVLLAWIAATLAPSAAAATTYTAWVIDSGVVEPLGGGQVVTGEAGTITGSMVAAGRYVVTSTDIFGKPWTFTFVSTAQPTLPVGHYSSATGVMVKQGTKVCIGGGQSFDIIEPPVLDAAGKIKKLAVDFRGNCRADGTGPLVGSLRIGSSLPTSLLRVTSDISFPDTVVGETSAVQEIDVLGVGDATIHVGSAALTGPDADQFTIEDGCAGHAIAMEDECKIKVWFTPTVTTAKRATVVVPTDALEGDRETDLKGYALSILTKLPSAMVMDARDQDPVSRTDRFYDPASSMLVFGGDQGLTVQIDGWSIVFQAEAADPVIRAGTYDHIAIGASEGIFGFHASRNGSACSPSPGEIEGSVTILQPPIRDTDLRVLQFAADFEQHCRDMPGTLRGWIRFHSDIPVPKWTQPKIDLAVSATTAQVGDTITLTPTIAPSVDFFDVKRCHMLIQRPGVGPYDGARMQVASDDCAPWTLTIPDTDPGRLDISAWVEFSDDPGISQGSANTLIDGLDIVAGGSPVPFASNYPVQSWAFQDYATDTTPTYGTPQTYTRPPGADGCRMYLDEGFEQGWTQQDSGCGPWTFTLLSPASDGAGFFVPHTWARTLSWSGSSMWSNPDPEQGHVGSRWGEMYRAGAPPMTGSGGSYASDLPMVFAGSVTGGVYYVDEPTPTTWAPTVVGTASGTCRYSSTNTTFPVAGGGCGHGTIPDWVSPHNGSFSETVSLLDPGGTPIAGSTFGIGYVEHMSPLALDVSPTAQYGSDLGIGASTAKGAPVNYAIDVEEVDTPVATFSGDLSPGPGHDGDRVDVAAADLEMGQFEVTATFTDVKGETRTATKVIHVVDTTGPSGTIAVNAGSPYTATPTVVVDLTATDVSGVTDVALSNDGTHWTQFANASSLPWTITATDGTRKVYAKWRDGLGNWSSPKTDTIILDRVAPTVSGMRPTFRSAIAFAPTSIATRISWTGSDASSGIATYEVAEQVDGGTWVTIGATVTAAHVDRLLTTGHDYRYRTRAVDHTGHLGAWSSTSPFHLVRRENSSSSVHYSGSWTTSTSTAYSGGNARVSSHAGAKAWFSATARSIALVSRVGPTRGKASIYIDGTKVATIDLYAATAEGPRVVYVKSWTTSGHHQIVVRVSGTTGRPSVAVDAFIYSS